MHIAHAVEVRPASPRLHPLPERSTCTVILTSGPADGGRRATLAFSAAFTAQSMDLDTLVFLVGDGAYWGYEGRVESVHAPGFPALRDLIDGLLEAEGRIVLCSTCDAICATDVDAAGVPLRRLPGVRPQGLASVISHSTKGSSLTF